MEKQPTKKRKTSSGGYINNDNNKNNTTTTTSSSSSSTSFDCVLKQNDEQTNVGPFVATFPQGPPALSILTNDTDESAKIQFFCQQSAEGTFPQYKLVANSRKIKYVARSTDADSTSQYLIAVREPGSTQLTLLPVTKLYQFQQVVKGVVDETKDNTFADVTKSSHRQSLYEKFAPAKIANRSRKMMENSIKESNVVGMDTVVQETLKNVQIVESITVNLTTIPPFNKETAILTDVYPIDQVITQEEMEALGDNEYFNLLLEKDQSEFFEQISYLPSFTRYILEKWHSLAFRDDLEQYCQILRYMTYLIIFYKIGGNKIIWVDYKKAQIPDKILTLLVKKFSQIQNNGSYRTDRTNTKCLHYICVLALSVSKKLRSPTDFLSKDLGINMSQMSYYFRNVGCKVAPVQKRAPNEPVEFRVLARLQAPLQFPAYKARLH